MGQRLITQNLSVWSIEDVRLVYPLNQKAIYADFLLSKERNTPETEPKTLTLDKTYSA